MHPKQIDLSEIVTQCRLEGVTSYLICSVRNVLKVVTRSLTTTSKCDLMSTNKDIYIVGKRTDGRYGSGRKVRPTNHNSQVNKNQVTNPMTLVRMTSK